MTTICDICGAEYPREYDGNQITPMEGESLLPAFYGDKQPVHEAIFWEHIGNRAIRRGEWKLVARTGEPWELYNLTTDRSETVNLIAHEAQIAEELLQMYEEWALKVGVK